ncbi:MAG: FtsX-like permease family protein [Clostridiales bacterium]|nr:FtsX-like permease family protein [Clostridiales bacterium]
MDFLIQGTLGLTEEDVTALEQEPYIERAAGKYSLDMLMRSSVDESYVTRVIGEDFNDEKAVSRVQLIEGRLPAAADECVIEVPNQYAYVIPVGEVFTIDPQNKGVEELHESLRKDAFKVVGIVRTPQFMHMMGDTSSVGDGTMVMAMYVPENCFDLDHYTAIYATVTGGKELQTYSDAYRSLIGDVTDRLKPFGEQRAAMRTEQIRSDARKEYDDAREEFEKEKADAYAQLDDAKAAIADGRTKLEDGRQQLEEGRSQLAEAKAKIADGRNRLTEGKAQLADGQAQIDEARRQIGTQKHKIEEGTSQIRDGREQIADGRTQIRDARKQIADGRSQLTNAAAALDEQETALQEQEAQLAQIADTVEQLRAAQAAGYPLTEEQTAMIAAYDDGMAKAAAARQQIEQGREQLAAEEQALDKAAAALDEQEAQMNAAEQELNAKEQELQNGAAEITAAENELNSRQNELNASRELLGREENELNTGEQELISGEAELEENARLLEENGAALDEAEKEYLEAKAEAEEKLADGEKELTDALEQINKIKDGKWIIRDRSDNIGMSEYDSDSAKIGAIAKIFPVFFFIIAALVALTTLTRMVEEERGRIGTLKSLGYSNGAILRYYLLYGFAASAAGCLIGIPAGCIFFPKVISNAYTMMYVLPPIDTPVLPGVAIPVAAGLTGMILLATWLSCRDMLREKPAALLLPKAPKVGKRILLERIGPLWRRLPFSRKVTLRNIFRYKKRFLMTIIGVAGCFALLLAGFGIRDSIGNLVLLQYGEVTHYDYAAEIDQPEDVQKDETLAAILADASLTEKWCAFSESPVTIRANGKKEESTFRIPQDPDALEDYITLRERTGHTPIPYEKGSVILTEKSAERLGVRPGDTLQLTTDDGTEQEVVLTAVCENYIGSFVYMYTEDYESLFDESPSYTTLYIRAGKKGQDGAAAEALLKSDQVLYIVDTQVVSDNFEESVKSIDYIILVLIVASAALAIIVLYNLTNVNICERRKELATIRVLGFYRPEVSAYIFREVDILAVIGILVGMPVGIWLHHYIIITVEVAAAMFGRTIHWQSYLIAAGFTILFTLLVNLIMRPQIRKIDMVESMKAVD